MKDYNYELYDVVELKKAHPCNKKNKYFQIIKVGADIKFICQSCGNILIVSRDVFNQRFKKIISKNDHIILINKK